MLVGTIESTDWFHLDEMQAALYQWTPAKGVDALRRLEELLDLWEWRNGKKDVEIVAGLVIATWIQALWEWRPQIGIVGRGSSGKTVLFHTLEQIFGTLCVSCSQSTPAGIRQTVQNTSRIVLIDEFDSSPQQQRLIDMIRVSSRGGRVLRGSSSQQSHHQDLAQMFWLAGVYLSTFSRIDQERFITLEVESLGRGNRVAIPKPSELKELGIELLVTALMHSGRALKIAKEIVLGKVSIDVQPRMKETLSVPVAIYSAVVDEVSPCARFDAMCDHLVGFQPTDVTEDERRLLDEILSYRVQVGGGVRRNLYQLLLDSSLYYQHLETIESIGVTVRRSKRQGRGAAITSAQQIDYADDDELILFLDHNAIRKHVLRGTEWANVDLRRVLCRLPGVKLGSRSLCGRIVRNGIEIPWTLIKPPDEEIAKVDPQSLDVSEVMESSEAEDNSWFNRINWN